MFIHALQYSLFKLKFKCRTSSIYFFCYSICLLIMFEEHRRCNSKIVKIAKNRTHFEFERAWKICVLMYLLVSSKSKISEDAKHNQMSRKVSVIIVIVVHSEVQQDEILERYHLPVILHTLSISHSRKYRSTRHNKNC